MRLLPSITLTQHQADVIKGAISDKRVSITDVNAMAARTSLMRLGLIHVTGTEVTVTDKGMQVAKANGIVDDSGAVTPDDNTADALSQQPPAMDGMNSMDAPQPSDIQIQSHVGFAPGQLLKELLNNR